MRTKVHFGMALVAGLILSANTMAFSVPTTTAPAKQAATKTADCPVCAMARALGLSMSCCPDGDCCPNGACCSAAVKATAKASCCPDGACCPNGECCKGMKAAAKASCCPNGSCCPDGACCGKTSSVKAPKK